MKQIIIRNKKVMCTTTVPYPKDIIKSMKSAGYKIKEEKTEEEKDSIKHNKQ